MVYTDEQGNKILSIDGGIEILTKKGVLVNVEHTSGWVYKTLVDIDSGGERFYLFHSVDHLIAFLNSSNEWTLPLTRIVTKIQGWRTKNWTMSKLIAHAVESPDLSMEIEENYVTEYILQSVYQSACIRYAANGRWWSDRGGAVNDIESVRDDIVYLKSIFKSRRAQLFLGKLLEFKQRYIADTLSGDKR